MEPVAGPKEEPGKKLADGFSRQSEGRVQEPGERLKGQWSLSWPLSWAQGQGARGGQGAAGRCQEGVWFLPETGGLGPLEPSQ